MPSIFGDIIGVFDGQDLKNWLASAAGSISSGLETGIDAVFQDFWDVVIGPAEIFVGVVFILIALVFAFKDDLMQAGLLFGLAAA